MSITIIIEDGTQVANANSFVSVANARIYAVNRGVALPSSNDDLGIMLIKATDYLQAQANRFKGERVSADQALEWPRKCVYLYDALVPSNVIPKSLISAQIELAMVINAGLTLQPNFVPGDYVVKEKVGPIETQYSDPLRVGIESKFTAVDALLSLLFKSNSTGFSLTTIRV